MFSYWEDKHFFNYDLLVIGAGFVGLSTAIHFQRQHPKAKVLVLERGVLPTGASTKNAGFACFGSLTEILDDLWTMTQDEVVDLVAKRYKGLQKIRKEFGDKKLSYQSNGGFELIEEGQLAVMDQISAINNVLKGVFPGPVYSALPKYRKLGFGKTIRGVIKNRYEGELDPGNYVSSLWELAGKLGVKIITGLEVEELDPNQGRVEAKERGMDREFIFQGDLIAVCTNAFTSKIWKNELIEPGRGLVMISAPLDFNVPWKGCFHLDKGYVYFRQVEGRLLLGGARNMDFEGERNSQFEVNPKIKSYLQKLAQEVIFPGKPIRWHKEWTGIMAFGPSKSPIIQKIGERSAAAVRLGGMGVALGWQAGKELSELLSKGN